MIKGLKNIVTHFLVKNDEIKNNDNVLIANIWFDELKRHGINPKEMNAFEFLAYYAKGQLQNPRSIIRCRAKLQEEQPELRGKKYIERKKNLEIKVRQEIKNWDE
jgi:hypothetical protein